MDQVTTKVSVGSREYPLKVDAADEELIRDAVKSLNDRLRNYEKLYTGSDKYDHLAMCAIQIATEVAILKRQQQMDSSTLQNSVRKIDELLANHFEREVVL